MALRHLAFYLVAYRTVSNNLQVVSDKQLTSKFACQQLCSGIELSDCGTYTLKTKTTSLSTFLVLHAASVSTLEEPFSTWKIHNTNVDQFSKNMGREIGNTGVTLVICSLLGLLRKTLKKFNQS